LAALGGQPFFVAARAELVVPGQVPCVGQIEKVGVTVT
jgi:hypothetical protein